MRVLKFRFWKNKQLMGFRELNTGGIIDIPWDWDSVDQFTGLLDKTGVEIYEGDVCRASYVCLACFDSDPHILTGEITKDSFGAWMFDFGHGAMAISYLIMDEGSDIEVIGNVCENPELVG